MKKVQRVLSIGCLTIIVVFTIILLVSAIGTFLAE